ncbi:hypothetical protein PPYR_14638 [Photinus pyralis]|uniref:CRAL-TRIO domain-containing protein n=2 Tax=Photinus pyralis TaxID=7054 RepID=A0A1Y1K3A9_PHOPY|nr:clavesin-2-like isoform X2 [Photinus pyralis]XP_031356086.1 clavesin-2-like isoform X2 [Photinus pyralis]KAB0792679.1 hypothetical protein PPYR_14638 [Photinus pyralis]
MGERKWVSEADEYVCALSEDTQKIAKDTLGEDKNVRDQALESMRHWITHNPRILNCRLDSNFLLRFLRFSKFSVVQAQIALERYLLLRQSYGMVFREMDIKIPKMTELLQTGFLFVCPKRDKNGRRVYIIRPGAFDLSKYTNADMLKIAGIAFETLIEDEENQVKGFVYLADGQGCGLPYVTLFTPLEMVRLVKNGEKTVPARHIEIHGLNVHPTMKFAYEFGISLISEKIRKRIKLYSTIEEFLAGGTMELDILPKEYGGTTPMSEMIDNWKEELLNENARLLSHDEMAVQEELFSSKERDGAVSALRASGGTCGNEDSMYGVTGNFRKLEVD